MIIIKTPQPDTEERLVLVPALHALCPSARDATPADLERGGYERLGPEVLRVSAAEWRELKLRAEGREAHGEPGTLAHLRNDLRDAISRAEAAEGLLIQRETELRLAREDGAAVERQMREARSAADQSFVRANRAEMRAEKAERERDEARDCGQVGVCAVTPGCQRHWAERARELLAERDTLRAEVARLTAPGEGEPTDNELRAVWDPEPTITAARRALFRAGVAHERARQQPAKGRATDEELFAIADGVYEEAHGGEIPNGPHEIARRVAARVRQEPGIVERAVGRPTDLDESLALALTVGLAECERLRATIAKYIRRTNEQAEILGAVALVLATPAEQRTAGDLDTLLAENAKLHGDLDAIAIAMGLANEHEGHVQRADIERLCEDALAARRAEAMLADVQSENAKLRAVAEAARDLAECDAHGEFCDVPILAEKRGRARGRDDSDDWNEAECDCCAGRARKALLAALEAP